MSPTPSSCAICVAFIVGAPTYEPLGRDDAMVAICAKCSFVPPPRKLGRPRNKHASAAALRNRAYYARSKRQKPVSTF